MHSPGGSYKSYSSSHYSKQVVRALKGELVTAVCTIGTSSGTDESVQFHIAHRKGWTIPAATTVYTSDSNRNFSAQDVFNKKEEMSETLPHGSISNTHANAQGGYRDQQGHDVSYKRETQTAVDPGKEYALLKEEEKRVVETDLEPGVISRHVTTKYYKKKTVTDTTTTTTPQ
ncbi:unnamed protein product [Heligmosomoides polygyrus]|uniref:Ig-like_bact domain-containing protein n=1 Tax=Heligmosomoides polygyrus TaxID=6339 RepID=A0A183GSC5_HELPZ|nr:unnamed protein product [Heligmosomoides polygyrus]